MRTFAFAAALVLADNPALTPNMVKMLLILIMGTAFAQGLSNNSQPPLLIQDTRAAPLDGAR